MSEEMEKEIYNHYGISLKRAPAIYMEYTTKMGILTLIDYGPTGLCFQWNLDEYKVVENCEWSIVVSDGPDPLQNDSSNDSKSNSTLEERRNKGVVRVMSSQLKGLEISKNDLKCIDKSGISTFTFTFYNGSIETFCQFLERSNFITKIKRGVYKFVDYSERDKLHKSFAELDIGEIMSNKRGRNTSAFEVLAAIGHNFLPRSRDDMSTPSPQTPPHIDNPEVLHTEEANNVEKMVVSMATETDDSYLPPRTTTTRAQPLTEQQLNSFQCEDGSYRDVDQIMEIIFRGGIESSTRPVVWKFLLNYDLWQETHSQRELRRSRKTDDYFRMKRQWMSISIEQENNFSDYRDRKCQIEKDVKRTDRNLEYFEGEDNPNLVKLQNILMTYIMYNFDLGYVQGMSDLLAPILMLMENEEDSFWCFVGFMEKVFHNFDIDQAGMKKQLKDTNTLLSYTNQKLYNYFVQHQSENMYFCFRWLLVWFKREFSNSDILQLWEVLFTGKPCKNFHLFIALAILDEESFKFMENQFEFNEILKHINELSGSINLTQILTKAEAIYIQVKNSTKLTDEIRRIIGELPSKTNTDDESRSDDERIDNTGNMQQENSTMDSDENSYEKHYDEAISNSFL